MRLTEKNLTEVGGDKFSVYLNFCFLKKGIRAQYFEKNHN